MPQQPPVAGCAAVRCDRLCRVCRVRHAAMAALLGLSARQAVQETNGAKSCSLRRYQKLASSRNGGESPDHGGSKTPVSPSGIVRVRARRITSSPKGTRSRSRSRVGGSRFRPTRMLRDASPVPRPTTNPNSPMSCSPTSWPGGCRPHRCPIKQSSPRTGAPRDGEHIVWSRRSRDRPATAHPNAATFHENPDPGRRHLHPRGLRSSSRAGDGPVLHQQQPKKSSPRSYDQAVAARLWQISVDLVRSTATSTLAPTAVDWLQADG